MTWVRPTGAVGTRNVLSQPSNAVRSVRRLYRVSDGIGGQRKLQGGGEGAISTVHHSVQGVGCVADGEGEW